MLRTGTIGSCVVAATALLGTSISLPATAEAHGHHGGVYVGVGFGGFYGWGPYYGWGAPYWGWGPGWGWGSGPYYYGGAASLVGYAMASGMGGLDVDVKPNQAEVWVDGKYVAEARDLDGDPSYLWLKQGPHRVAVYKSGYRTFEEEMDVRTGIVRGLKLQLQKGDSTPPTRAADVKGAAEVKSTERAGEPRLELPHAEASGVRLRALPPDATIYLDGQFRGTAREVAELHVAPGRHRIELVRPGFRPLDKEFEVEADRPVDLELSMERP